MEETTRTSHIKASIELIEVISVILMFKKKNRTSDQLAWIVDEGNIATKITPIKMLKQPLDYQCENILFDFSQSNG